LGQFFKKCPKYLHILQLSLYGNTKSLFVFDILKSLEEYSVVVGDVVDDGRESIIF
jgi:hypothetical protein